MSTIPSIGKNLFPTLSMPWKISNINDQDTLRKKNQGSWFVANKINFMSSRHDTDANACALP